MMHTVGSLAQAVYRYAGRPVRPARYSADCLAVAGRLIDHDDDAPEDAMARAAESTDRAWRGVHAAGSGANDAGAPLLG